MIDVETTQPLTKGQKTAQRILDAAALLFAEKGYRNTSLREVAALVGIREPGLYRHFKNKEELYRQVLERALRPILDLMDELLKESQPSADLATELPEIMFDLLSQSPHVSALLQQVVINHQHTSEDDIVQCWVQELFDRGRLLLRHLKPQEEISDFDITLRIFNLFNLCIGYFSAASLFSQLSGEDALARESLIQQKAMLRRIAASLVAPPPH